MASNRPDLQIANQHVERLALFSPSMRFV